MKLASVFRVVLVALIIAAPVFPTMTQAGGVLYGPIEFDETEFPLQTVIDGLTINTLNGVTIPTLTFGFLENGNASNDAQVGEGFGDQQFVDRPGILGDSDGIVTIDFGLDVDWVRFGAALTCPLPVDDAFEVGAFDDQGQLVGVEDEDARITGFALTEGQVELQTTAPFRAIAIRFNELGGLCPIFILDNVEYREFVIPVELQTFTVD